MGTARARQLAVLAASMALVTGVRPGAAIGPRSCLHGRWRTATSSIVMGSKSKRRKLAAALDEWEDEYDAWTARAGERAERTQNEVVQNPLPFQYLCVVDVEATCEEEVGFHDQRHEIIEFPVVVLDLSSGSVTGEFHSYVRPTDNGTLSAFCSQLTGISQQLVDAAPTLSEVLSQFEEWRVAQGLEYTAEEQNFAFAADGVWDLRFFLHGECTRKGLAKPAYFEKWCNLKELFADFYSVRPCKIEQMLELQGMQHEGRLHSGIDDTRNIARIAARMAEDGAVIYVNEVLPLAMRNGGVLADRTVAYSKYSERG